MPFRIVQQLRYVSDAGNISPDEKFEIVMENGITLIGGLAFTEYPQTALCLHKDHWPNEVTVARNEMFAEFRAKYPEHEIRIDCFMAWIRTPHSFAPPNELAVGTRGLIVAVQYGVWREGSRSVTYASTIVDLRPLS